MVPSGGGARWEAWSSPAWQPFQAREPRAQLSFRGLCCSLDEVAPEPCLSEKCDRPLSNRSDGCPLWPA